MRYNKLLFSYLIASTVLLSDTVVAQQPTQRRQDYDKDYSGLLKKLQDDISQLRHQVENHESDIRSFEDKVTNQDVTIEGLRQDVTNTHSATKDQVKSSTSTNESRISAMEATQKNLVADMKQLKDISNETASALTMLSQKINKLEKNMDQQKGNIENLESALKSIMEALQIKEAPSNKSSSSSIESGKTYRVKAGDSLEKIAKDAGKSIQSIKDANGLASDKIVVGQKLVIP
jgi:LysM repeat protein